MATDRQIDLMDALKDYRRRIEDIDEAVRLAQVVRACDFDDQQLMKTMSQFCRVLNNRIRDRITILRRESKITKEEERL